MMKMGAMATINQVLDQETAQLVAEKWVTKLSYVVKRVRRTSHERS